MPGNSRPGTHATDRHAEHGVRIVDSPVARVHHPGDLFSLTASAIGIAIMSVLAAFAQNTTTGVAQDVRGFASIVRDVVFLPVSALQTLVTIGVPIAVLVALLTKRLLRTAAEALLASVLGVIAALITVQLITHFGILALQASFSVYRGGTGEVTIPMHLVALAAMLTVAGPRSRRSAVAWSWNALWLTLGISMITGLLTLPGAVVTALVGRMVGTAVRFVSGTQSERAYGRSLVDGIRRCGLDPAAVVRVHDLGGGPSEGSRLVGERPRTDIQAVVDPLAHDPSLRALARHADQRVYAVVERDRRVRNVLVLDGDRQVVGLLTRWWRSLRLRGIDARAMLSLRQYAERTALLSHAATSAGVRTPQLLSMAEADDSMLLVFEHITGAIPLTDLDSSLLDDATLDLAWEQLQRAHQVGLAHRAVSADAVLVDLSTTRPDVLLGAWESGDVAASPLARRVDIAQLMTALALRVGASRAVASASRVLQRDLATIGPILQTIAMPPKTREELRSQRTLLAELREQLLELLPEADVEPERLVRFGARSVAMISLTVVAVVLVMTTINLDEIRIAIEYSQPAWALVVFGLGIVSLFGAALTMIAFSPVRLSLWTTTLVQTAAAFVTLVAPTGLGSAAMNMRLLSKHGVSNALSVASVGLVQLTQALTSLTMLLVFAIASGTKTILSVPSSAVLLTLGIIIAALGIALLVPQVRRWAARKVLPTWRQTWPRFIRLLAEPKRFLIAAIGNVILTGSFLLAFWASAAAFGQDLSLVDAALIFLIASAAGVIVPTPGGLGTVELALLTGLTTTGGIPAGVAASIVALDRALTFWARIPIGWLAMRRLQATNRI